VVVFDTSCFGKLAQRLHMGFGTILTPFILSVQLLAKAILRSVQFWLPTRALPVGAGKRPTIAGGSRFDLGAQRM
jgi:hypothetical protein